MNGASIAGQLGLPFSLASHFAPDQIDQAIRVYRETFRTDAPTARLDTPRVMAGINVIVADTDAAAQREFTTLQQMFLDLRAGRSRKLQPPVDPAQFGGASPAMLEISAVGSPATVKAQLEEFVERTGADELITVTYAFDPAVRARSLELLAELWF